MKAEKERKSRLNHFYFTIRIAIKTVQKEMKFFMSKVFFVVV
jgi:hypothetical protein